jgi:hypothetical protein
MIVIITGAIKNTGDYLIAYRAKKLLQKYVDPEIVEINRFQPLQPSLPLINKSKALILCGGPAYTSDIFDGIYNLSSLIDEIRVPIIPFGLGWCGKPYPNYPNFTFSIRSLEILKKIHLNIPYSSCRDVITRQILENHGIKNVNMTGCPVWYDNAYIEKEFQPPENIKSIVVTTPARQDLLFQTISLLDLIKLKYKNAELFLTFHRGILPGLTTPPRKGLAYTLEAFAGKIKGYTIKDVSGSLNNISFYNNCDLHIGYRVHAHLLFLSNRKPSFLINEDGRGYAFSQSLRFQNFNSYDKNMLDSLGASMDYEIDNNYLSFKKIIAEIDKIFNQNMLEFLESIKKITN